MNRLTGGRASATPRARSLPRPCSTSANPQSRAPGGLGAEVLAAAASLCWPLELVGFRSGTVLGLVVPCPQCGKRGSFTPSGQLLGGRWSCRRCGAGGTEQAFLEAVA